MSKIIFSKYSNDRNEKYRIRTDILLTDSGKKEARKVALTDSGKERLKYIAKMYDMLKEELSESKYEPNSVYVKDDMLYFEYVEGGSVLDRLQEYAADKNIDEYEKLISDFSDFIKRNATEDFTATERFTKIFGEASEISCNKSLKVTDVDMIFENQVIRDDKIIILDYEWTYDFPIPVDYVLYRAYLYLEKPDESFITDERLKELFGITEEDIPVFDSMEKAFQESIIKGYAPLWKLYDTIGKAVLDPQATVANMLADMVYKRAQTITGYSTGLEGVEDFFIPTPMEDGGIRLDIAARDGVEYLRIDPAERMCIVYIREFKGITEDSEYDIAWDSNGSEYEKNVIVFDTLDPQIWPLKIEEHTVAFRVIYNIEYISDYMAKEMVKEINDEQTRTDKYSEDMRIISKEVEDKGLENFLLMIRNERERKEYDRILGRHDELTVKYWKLSDKYDDLKAEYDMKVARIEELEEDYRNATDECEAMKQTVSWKVTKPIRAVRHIGRKERR